MEAGVKVVTNWVIHALADRRFADLDELNEAIAERVEVINDRTPFRGEQRSRRGWFLETEQAELMTLPEQRWEQVDWRKAKVSRDWHVQVDTVKYSVPHQHAGQLLDVRIVGEQVSILVGGEIVATHPRAARRNVFVTNPDHAPAGYEDTSLLWTRAYFLRQGEKVGPYTVQALGRLLDRHVIEAQGYRACMNILGLGKSNNRPVLEQACQDLCTHEEQRQISYTAVKNQMAAVRAGHHERPTTQHSIRPRPDESAGASPTPRDRNTEGAHLSGIAEFSLEALRRTTSTTEQMGADHA